MDGRGLVTVRIVGTRNMLDVGTGVELKSCLKVGFALVKFNSIPVLEEKTARLLKNTLLVRL